MERFLHRFSEFGYLIFRLGVAFLFIFHAPQKWLGWYGGPQSPMYSLRSLAGLVEAIASPLIALGLLTSYAAFFAGCDMIGAYYISHVPTGYNLLKRPGWPIENRGELAVLYFLAFLFIMFRGGGKYSLDRIWRGKG